MIQLILIIGCISTVFILFLKNYRAQKILSHFDGPAKLPFIGNAHLLMGYDSGDLLWRINEIILNYKTPMKFWLASQLILIFTDPNQIEEVMTSYKYAHKGEIYELIKDILGNGLVSGSGSQWKAHRKIIQPLFNLKFVNHSMRMFEMNVKSCLDELEEYADGETFDMQKAMSSYATDCLGELIMGIKFDNKHLKNSFIENGHEMYTLLFERMTKPWLYPDFAFTLTKKGKHFFNFRNYVDNIVRKCMSESKIRRKQILIAEDNYTLPVIDQLGIYCDKNPGKINEVDFMNHIKTLYFASSDTISLVSAVLCMFLGMYPESQRKVYDEIGTILGESPGNITTREASKLNYLDMCIKEVLRLLPIAPYILRKTLNDTELDGFLIPKDCNILVPIFNLHKDKKYWEKPEEFYPEHFLPEKVKQRPEFVYMPFSAGTRACIGKNLAMMTIKLIIANVLSIYEIEADGKIGDVKLIMDISVRPAYGSLVRLRKRKQ